VADGEWLPILHTYDGPLKLYASFPLAGNRLHFGFAKALVSDNGRITLSHLLKNRLEAMSDDEFTELGSEAFGNLTSGLRFMGSEDPE
jgi:hypothetical protein